MQESVNEDSAQLEPDNLVIFPGKLVVSPYSQPTLNQNERITYNRVNYTADRHIATGGFGAIYGGHEESNPNHKVVIKEMLSDIPEALLRDEYTVTQFIEKHLWHGQPSQYIDAADFYNKLTQLLRDGEAKDKYKEYIEVAFFNYFGILPKDLRSGRTMRFQTKNCAEFISDAACEFLKTPQAQTMRQELNDAHERFTREATILARLDEVRGVPQLIGVVRDREYANPASERYLVEYLIQDYIDGKTLKQELQLGTANPQLWSQSATVQFMNKVLLTVEEFQKRQIIHNDLNPSNIIVDRRNNPWIIDYGIADDAANISNSSRQRINSIILSQGYCSPEQFKGLETTFRSDIYSLGIILYEMLSGKHPQDQAFLNLKYFEREEKIDDDLEAEDRLGLRIVQKELADIVLKAVAENPNRRYQTAAEMRRALSRVKVESGIQRYANSRKRRKVALQISGVAGGAALISAIAYGGIYAIRTKIEATHLAQQTSIAATATAYAPIQATQIAKDKIQAEIDLVHQAPQFRLDDQPQYEEFKEKIIALYKHPEIEVDYSSYYHDYISYTAYQNNIPSPDTTSRRLKEYYANVRNDPKYAQKSEEEILQEFFDIVPIYGLGESTQKKCKLMEAYKLSCK